MSDSQKTQIAVMNENIKQIKDDVTEMKTTVRRIEEDATHRYVSKEEFDTKIKPIEKIVYGMVGLVLISFFTAVVTFFIRSGR